MSSTEIAFIAVLSAVLTIPAVLLIPRARQSRAFDVFLWIATWVIGFLGAWGMLGYTTAPGSDFALNRYVIGDVPVVTLFIGVAGGIIFLHLVLWGIDRLAHPASEMEEFEDEEFGKVTPDDATGAPPELSPTPEEPQERQEPPR